MKVVEKLENDVREWADKTMDDLDIPADLQDNFFEAAMRLRPAESTVFWLERFFEEVWGDMASEQERLTKYLEDRARSMTNRQLLEAIYLCLFDEGAL